MTDTSQLKRPPPPPQLEERQPNRRILTALRGFTPLRTTVTSLGRMKSFISRLSGPPALALPRDGGPREDAAEAFTFTDQLGFTFFV
ncbi:hypothetical protein EYF80_035696 [Liparis tanakae]|uniref:Uncharacterized protein n=1 Tax=Liparis tanakae TaxID=230148 RepID=A0A4Z2GLD4_9TELE|nr:hypothetical protein EYF80_035696 [Liparis tanakae]